MVPMATNDDQWIADVTTYIRNSFGNKAPLIAPEFVAALRKNHSDRSEPWTVEELEELEAPILPYQKTWKISASHNEGTLKAAFDKKAGTRYTTKKSMVPGMWVQVEMPSKTRFSGVILDTNGSKSDHPRSYSVQVSDDGKTWSEPVAEGLGDSAFLEIFFPAVDAKFLRVTQTGKDGHFWSIHELELFGKLQ